MSIDETTTPAPSTSATSTSATSTARTGAPPARVSVDAAVSTLRAEIHGGVLTPEDDEYASAVRGWNLAAAHSPAVVVAAVDTDDVVAAVRAAASCGLGVGIQGTGHGAVRPIDGLMLLTSRLQELHVDPLTRTARVGAGCTTGAVLEAATAHGLAPQIGSSVTAGAVGFALGGGMGWLSRKYGPACDAVRSFDVVTPSGELVRASAHENAELFRALRGGGGGVLGVVTAMEIELYPVPSVYAGNLLYPAPIAAEVAGAYATWVANAPDELSTSLVFMNFPPIPDVPEPLRGQSFLIIRGCWCGDIEAGRALLDTWRTIAPPLIDMWDELPFSAAAMIANDPVDPMPFADTGAWLTGFDGDAAATIAAHTFPTAGPPPVMFTEVRHAGGAIASNDRSRSAMGNRDGQFLFHTIDLLMDPSAGFQPTAGQQAVVAALGDRVARGTYHNFLDGEARRAATHTSVAAEALEPLAALEHRLDPQRLLRFGVEHAS